MSQVNSVSLENKKLNQIEKELNSQFESSVAENILSSIGIAKNKQLKWLNNFPIIEQSFQDLMSYEVNNL